MSTQTVNAEELQKLMDGEFSAGRGIFLTVTGYSMRPVLKHLRDQVYLVPPEQRKPCRGEIVFFRRDNGTCILHRILKEDGETFIINGDAQTWTERIRRDQVFAVAEGIVRRGKYISCSNPVYQMYVFVWRLLKPLRGLMRAVTAALKGHGK